MRKNMYFFPGQISGADRSENLHDGRALSRIWVVPLLVAISLGVSKWGGGKMVFFGQFVIGILLSVCVINTITATHQWILCGV